MRCSACGGGSLVGGSLIESDSAKVCFKPEGGSILWMLFGKGNRPVRAYGCTRCSHLQLAVEFTKEDLEKYQSFEGEQQRSVIDDPPGEAQESDP